MNIKRALISCWDKSGLIPLAGQLAGSGVEIISSGGTYNFLTENKIPVTKVEEITRFKEILNGRVKTLHPFIHGAILAKRTPEHLKELRKEKIEPIDLVIVNLYPFVSQVKKEHSLSEMIELIDIGGPAMLRAAAKNYEYVVVLHHPNQYSHFMEIWEQNQHSITVQESLLLAKEVFFHTAYYDAQIFQYLENLQATGKIPERITRFYHKSRNLRYGENPHQVAAYFKSANDDNNSDDNPQQLWGKEMSYNNYVDAASAISLVYEFEEPAVAIIKHTNPCGMSIDSNLCIAFEKARAGDPISAFGGIVASNRMIDTETARLIKETFFECIIAPDYSGEGLKILQGKKNLRILKNKLSGSAQSLLELKAVGAGLLVQETDRQTFDSEKIQQIGKRKPTAAEENDLYFAWKVVKHVKSNAIVFAKNGQVIGVGAGQMSRVDSVKLARQKAEALGHDLRGAVMASDAFFPFRDGIDEAAQAGIAAVIQPGGSVRDQEVIDAVQEHQMVMILTHMRHFKH
ncbi:MAG: bifunctional phosphoribosylaminoimidazolecarboxamide formyltransferase/IMP cyclohydrolase [bacterium]|nr:MAG: bifunctional phosphoribosylaminoimidazolecarboxamide formyltransferase/IMP cyclohydrolase [bacterium]